MTPEDIREIGRIAEEYFTDDWIWGRYGNSEGATRRRRIEGVGEFSVSTDLIPPSEPGMAATIRKVNLQGDFFLLSDLDEGLLDSLKGAEFSREGIMKALEHVSPPDVITGLTAEKLTDLLLETT